jgi:hypothetical protein
MGVRTRGLDIKAGAAKLKADKATRLEAELVIDRWNRRVVAHDTGSSNRRHFEATRISVKLWWCGVPKK